MAMLALVAALPTIPVSAQTDSARNAAFAGLLHSLDGTVSWCVQQYNAMQHKYDAYRRTGLLTFSYDDLAGAEDACLPAEDAMPSVLRPYAAVRRIVRDWNAVVEDIDDSVRDMGGVAFDGTSPRLAESDIVRHLRSANVFSADANALGQRTARAWGMQQSS